jgi:hypothetical protein
LRRVSEVLTTITGKEPVKTGMEDTMVALGAATLTAKEVRVGRGSRIKLRPVRLPKETTPHALGALVNAPPGHALTLINSVVIEERVEIPVERSKEYKLPYAEFFDVPVLQGRDEDPSRCSNNFTYRFKCLPETTPGSPVKVTFSYDSSNFISVKAVDLNRGRELQGEPIAFQMPQPGTGGATGSVDITFVVDATGSMAGCIEGVKRGIGDFCNDVSQSNFNYRLSLVEYRDEKIGERLRTYDWTDDVEKFRTWVSGLRAGGGGDVPESALDGVVAASRMQARPGAARIVVLVTDAVTHDPDEQGNSAEDVARMLNDRNIKLFAISPEFHSYKTLAERTGGRISDFDAFFRVGHVDPLAFKNVLAALGTQMINTLLTAAR